MGWTFPDTMLDYHSIPTVASTIESDVGGDLTSFEDGSWKENLSLCPAISKHIEWPDLQA